MVIKCICGRFMKRLQQEPGSNVSGARWEYRCSQCGSVAYLYSQSGDWEILASGFLETPEGKEFSFDPVSWRWAAEEPVPVQ